MYNLSVLHVRRAVKKLISLFNKICNAFYMTIEQSKGKSKSKSKIKSKKKSKSESESKSKSKSKSRSRKGKDRLYYKGSRLPVSSCGKHTPRGPRYFIFKGILCSYGVGKTPTQGHQLSHLTPSIVNTVHCSHDELRNCK